MSFLSTLSIPLAALAAIRRKNWMRNALQCQDKIFHRLISKARHTAFGQDHDFENIHSYQDFTSRVPLRVYEDFQVYLDRVKNGEPDVLWKGKPIYLSKTSGTTSGIKYIPITKDSISNHIGSMRDALLNYIHKSGNASFLNGKLMFISGSPALEKIGGIPTGRLSGIVNHHVPGYLRRNQLPDYATNCLEDWEVKVDAIVEATRKENMTLIGGIPPWVQMYFDRLIQVEGKPVKDIFPEFNLFVYGGVNFEPYRNKLEQSIGKRVDAIELYPASEGFIAYQDDQDDPALLLLADTGIFYEFIAAADFYSEHPKRIRLHDVELGKNYVLILNTNAGLWAYNLGDTIRFVSKDPYKIIVTGRIKHFISAFGEHVIAEEVEKAILEAARLHQAEIVEFTVAPLVSPKEGLPHHEWFIEFHRTPDNLTVFETTLDEKLQALNIYYRDLIQGHILRPLKVHALKKDAFINYMKDQGKLGGQNKVPRLANDRKIADQLMNRLL